MLSPSIKKEENQKDDWIDLTSCIIFDYFPLTSFALTYPFYLPPPLRVKVSDLGQNRERKKDSTPHGGALLSFQSHNMIENSKP